MTARKEINVLHNCNNVETTENGIYFSGTEDSGEIYFQGLSYFKKCKLADKKLHITALNRIGKSYNEPISWHSRETAVFGKWIIELEPESMERNLQLITKHFGKLPYVENCRELFMYRKVHKMKAQMTKLEEQNAAILSHLEAIMTAHYGLRKASDDPLDI